MENVNRITAFESSLKNKDLLTDYDRSLIKLMKKIEKIAYNPNLKFNLDRKDSDGNPSHRNSGLINFIKSCGYDYKEFIKSYLQQLHPFMIVSENNRSNAYFSCVIDASYRIPLWIECYLNEHNEQIISFHELNRFDKGYENYYRKQTDLLLKLDYVDETVSIGSRSFFQVSVVRGFETLHLELPGVKVDSCYVKVKRSDYEEVVLQICNERLDELMNSGFSDDYVNLYHFKKLKKLSFTSYGTMLQNQISLLVDLIIDTKSESLCTLLDIKMSELNRLTCADSIKSYLVEKYKNYEGVQISGLLEESL